MVWDEPGLSTYAYQVIRLSISNNYGNTWSAPVTIAEDEENYMHCLYPRIASALDGRWLVVFGRTPGLGTQSSGFIQSDNLSSWSPITIMSGVTPEATWAEGNAWHIVVSNERWQGNHANGGIPVIYFTGLEDDTSISRTLEAYPPYAFFSPDEIGRAAISSTGPDCSIAVWDERHTTTSNEDWDTRWSFTLDGGRTWSAGAFLDDDSQFDTRDDNYISIAASSNQAIVVWSGRNLGGDADIYYSTLDIAQPASAYDWTLFE